MRLKVIKRSGKTTIRDKMMRVKAFSSIKNSVPVQCSISSTFDSPAMETAVAVTAVAALLVDAGMHIFLYSCNKSKESSKLLIQRCAQFIVWSYSVEYNAQMIPTEENVTSWFGRLALEKYGHLLAFAEYLLHKRNLAPSTVRNYASDVEKLFSWGSLFAPASFKQPINSDEGIRAVAEIVRANQAQKHRHEHSENTWAAQVKHRRLPVGGLADLQAAVLEELAWARSVRRCDIDDVAYRTFVQLTVSAVYVFSANGRQSGVADVRMGQVQEMLDNGYATTSKFKTNQKYGYQPITLGDVSKELVHLYVSVVRPQVCRQHPVQAEDHVWLTYRGEPDLTIGKLVTTFFIRKRALSVTTTGIRGLVETEMHKKFKNGEISEVEKNAVHNINGHTSETTRDYYLFEDRADDVAHARNAFGQHRVAEEPDLGYMEDILMDLVDGPGDGDYGEPLQPLHLPLPPIVPLSLLLPAPLPLPLPLPLPHQSFAPSTTSAPVLPRWVPPYVPAVLQWGTAHPDYKTGKPTAQWTHEEKNYLGAWCERFTMDYPETKNVVAKCLKHISTDPRAVAIFHAHHTLNSARLRNGLRQFTAEAEDERQRRAMHRFTAEQHPEDMC